MIKLNIGKNILAARKRLGLTQEELASRVGYKTKSAINKIELGVRDLPQKKIAAFAQALDMTPGQLMGWEEMPAEELQDLGALAADVILDPAALEVMQKFMSMEESDRQAVRDFMALNEADRFALRLVMASMSEKQKKTDAGASVVESEKLAEKADCNM